MKIISPAPKERPKKWMCKSVPSFRGFYNKEKKQKQVKQVLTSIAHYLFKKMSAELPEYWCH